MPHIRQSNMAHTRQSRLDSGLGTWPWLAVKALKNVSSCSLFARITSCTGKQTAVNSQRSAVLLGYVAHKKHPPP